MPARPRQQVIRQWLKEQAGKGNELDYICERLEDGDTLVEIAAECEKATQWEIPHHAIRRWLQDQFKDQDVVARFTAARKEGSTANVEKAQHILDTVPEIQDAMKKADMRAKFLIWKAGVNNREAYGPTPSSQVTVNLTAGALHLQALRTRQVAPDVRVLPAVAEVAAVVDQLDDGDEQEQRDEAEREGEH